MVGHVLVFFGVIYLLGAAYLGFWALSGEFLRTFDKVLGLGFAAGTLLSGFLLVGFGELIVDVRALRKKLVADDYGRPAEAPRSRSGVPPIYEQEGPNGTTNWSFEGKLYDSEADALDARSEALRAGATRREPVF